MSDETETRLLTVKDIARAICFDKSEDGVYRMIRQLRHWTQSDLLRPFSAKSTGKGVPRVYIEDPTIAISAILLELTRYGATVDILKFVADEIYDHWDDEGGMYLLTALTDVNAYIELAWETDPATGRFIAARINMFDDLDDHEDRLYRDASSSIVINMTEVMERIYPMPWKEPFP
jgi:hypothetical protein